jgi:hypothetical protein
MSRVALLTLVGGVLAWPLGLLLSFLGSLPFMLGVFFFALFGLLVGAVMYRVGVSRRPLPRWMLRTASAIVVLTAWIVAISAEARGFPPDRAAFALEQVRALPAGVTRAQALAESERFLHDYLRGHHPPGGVLGYIQWELFGQRIGIPVGGGTRQVPINPEHWRWGLRVAVSVVLLAFGVHSQVAGLAKPDDSSPSPEAVGAGAVSEPSDQG